MSLSLHASAVAFDGQGVLITGASGNGKSTLAWQLIGLGGCLVADDRVQIARRDEGVWMRAPDNLQGKIEARGVGILNVSSKPAWAKLVIDMDQVEAERVPPDRTTVIEGIPLPLLRRVESPAFAPMLKAYLLGGVWDGSA